MGLPWLVRSRIGKSALIRSASSVPVPPCCVTATVCLLRRRVRLAQTELLADTLVALLLELVGQLLPAGLHDTPADHHVNEVGRDVVQDPLVVGDEQDPEVGPDQLRDTPG